ncbi:MAG: 2-oxoacid:acceptor oxidoreductase subunit alpha [Acidobacteria bacterium]|nr:MAG: 2-oxoacid:acceptor oxidoreductase subunit alpha [Acidobacteriota bacterium]
MAREFTIGIGGAAGDGLDKSGDTLAKSVSRRGLHVCAYNSYQSVIRGGHIWLRVRISEQKVYSHGDRLHLLIALNQDSVERHAPEVEPGGAVLYNSDRFSCDASLLGDGVVPLPLPVKEITKDLGRLLPIMQNTVALGAVVFLARLDFDSMAGVLADTFKHKGQAVIDQNVKILQAGFDYAKERFVPLAKEAWNFSGMRRPFATGNELFALGAVAAGCKFYSAYPMTPASSVLHWMASHGERCGLVVKQCEDELAVVNMAIGAGQAGVRAMCATSGGGFALMTEAIGMAGMIETPVVVVEVQRGGPSTGIPTKTEQGDLNQVYGASQGDFPRVIIAPTDTTDCYWATVESFNLAEKYQLPVLIISDLLLSEHPETIEPDALRHDVPIERGELVNEWPEGNGPYKRYACTPSGVSPRALPGTAGTEYVSATDEHDEEGFTISDVFTSPPVRRKIMEKRMKKMEGVIRELAPPKLEGPEDAPVTLIGWGSTCGVIREARALLAAQGIQSNHLHIKYIHPFHAEDVTAILKKCKILIGVEVNYSAQFARYLRAETGITVHESILKYDGEPFEPRIIAEEAKRILAGRPINLDVTKEDAREMAYHYVRTHLADADRPAEIELADGNSHGESLWRVQLVDRASGEVRGELKIGVKTGSIYAWEPLTAART